MLYPEKPVSTSSNDPKRPVSTSSNVVVKPAAKPTKKAAAKPVAKKPAAKSKAAAKPDPAVSKVQRRVHGVEKQMDALIVALAQRLGIPQETLRGEPEPVVVLAPEFGGEEA